MRLTPNLFWSESQPNLQPQPQPEPEPERELGSHAELELEPEMQTEQPVVAAPEASVPAVVIDEPKTTEVGTTEAAPASVLAPALDTKATDVCPSHFPVLR